MTSRTRIQAEIEATVALRDLLFNQINKAPAGPLDGAWLASRLADVRLVDACLDDLTGRLELATR